MEVSDWNCKAILFIVDIDGKSKFGIATSWEAQENQFEVDFPKAQIQLLMKTDFDHYWQAELVEQMMKWSLQSFIDPGLHQWLNDEFPLVNIIDCYKQILPIIQSKYKIHKHIHRKGNHRWAFYKRAYESLKGQFHNPF